VFSEVGMPTIRSPPFTRSPSSFTAYAAVEPVPSPTRMPSFTSATACAAATAFSRSTSMDMREFLARRDRGVEGGEEAVVEVLDDRRRAGGAQTLRALAL